MAMMIGDSGGIAVGVESTYGTAAATKVWQTPISASLGLRKGLIESGVLRATYPASRKYARGYCDGDTVTAYQRKRSVNSVILGSLGTLATNTYTFGAGTAPTNTVGNTVWIDRGGHLMQHTGCILTGLRWDLAANQPVRLTSTWLGRAGTKETPVSITAPSEADIQYDSDLATFTLGGATICILAATIEIATQVTGPDRACLGGAHIKKPVVYGEYNITASLTCELSSDTGDNTIAELDDYIAGTATGDLVIDDWTLAGTYMTGDFPALQPGVIQFPLNLKANYMTLTTEA